MTWAALLTGTAPAPSIPGTVRTHILWDDRTPRPRRRIAKPKREYPPGSKWADPEFMRAYRAAWRAANPDKVEALRIKELNRKRLKAAEKKAYAKARQ